METVATPGPGAATGAEGWFTTGPDPVLVGARCTSCATLCFPPVVRFCPNPHCAGSTFEHHPLSATGTVWSYTDARYQPPPPYVPATDPYEPVVIAAVELDGDAIVVLGQMAAGHRHGDLAVGQRVRLVVEPLFDEQLIWKWALDG